jgi:hypothetical protein
MEELIKLILEIVKDNTKVMVFIALVIIITFLVVLL